MKRGCRLKKGDSQVDWVIAISIFVLFLGYFFLLVKPLFVQQEKEDSMIYLIEEKLDTSLFWQVQKIPLIIKTNNSFSSYPLRAKITFGDEEKNEANIQKSMLAFSDNVTSYVDQGYFFGVRPISPSKYYFVSYSNKTYEDGSGFFELSSTNQFSRGHNLNATFDDGILLMATYHTQKRISDAEFFIDDNKILPESFGYEDAKLLAKYYFDYGYLNNTYYFYANMPIIDERIRTKYDTKIKFVTFSFNKYYINSDFFGNDTMCHKANTDAMIMYNDEEGLLIKADDDLSISFCMHENATADVEVKISSINDTWIRYTFFDGDLSEAYNYTGVETFFGIPSKIKGIDEEKLLYLNNSEYSRIKEEWNFDRTKDFQIMLTNSTTMIGRALPETNIYSKLYDTYILDGFGNKNPVKFSIMVW